MSRSKRCVVFAVDKHNLDGLDQCVEFYAFDEDSIPVENEQGESLDEACWPNKIKDPSQIARALSRQNHLHVFASYASLGCRVYCAGGLYFSCEKCKTLSEVDHIASRSVDCWDAIDNCWTRLPPMNLGRCLFGLHIFREKLFAVGGYRSRDKFIFIERLDGSEGCWTPLPYPPPTVKLDCNQFVSAAIEHKGFILFGSRAYKSFYAYTPPDTWKCMHHLPFDPDILLSRRVYSPAVVDNHLLWLDGRFGSTIIGFDVDSGNYFEIDLASEGLLPSPDVDDYFPQLVHVGNGVLALVWTDGCFHVLEVEVEVEVEVEGEGEGEGQGQGQGKGKGKGKGKDGELCNLMEAFRSFHCSRFSIDFVRAHAREKCCVLVSHQRCIGPKSFQRLIAAFVADLVVPVGNPSNSDIDGIFRDKRGRARSGQCF